MKPGATRFRFHWTLRLVLMGMLVAYVLLATAAPEPTAPPVVAHSPTDRLATPPVHQRKVDPAAPPIKVPPRKVDTVPVALFDTLRSGATTAGGDASSPFLSRVEVNFTVTQLTAYQAGGRATAVALLPAMAARRARELVAARGLPQIDDDQLLVSFAADARRPECAKAALPSLTALSWAETNSDVGVVDVDRDPVVERLRLEIQEAEINATSVAAHCAGIAKIASAGPNASLPLETQLRELESFAGADLLCRRRKLTVDRRLNELRLALSAREAGLKGAALPRRRAVVAITSGSDDIPEGCVLVVAKFGVPAVRWSPSYELRTASSTTADQATPDHRLVLFGELSFTARDPTVAGDDAGWSNVGLSLCTGRPQGDGASSLPSLTPLTLRVRAPPPDAPYFGGLKMASHRMARSVHREAEVAMAAADEDAGGADTAGQHRNFGGSRGKAHAQPVVAHERVVEASVAVEGERTCFDMPQGQYDLRALLVGGTAPLRLPVGQQASAIDLVRRASPIITGADVFQVITATNPAQGLTWYPGLIRVYIDGAFRGTRAMPRTRPTENATWVVGVDEDVTVRRTETRQNDDSGFALLGKTMKRRRNVAIVVENHRSHPVVVAVDEPTPVGSIEKVSVNVDWITPADGDVMSSARNPHTGIVAWRVRVPPMSVSTLNVDFTVSWPSSVDLEYE